MYRIYIFLLFISLQENSFSQFAYATAESGSIFYAGIDNPVSAVAENTSCKDIIVKVTYGSIHRDEDCRYTFKIDYDSIADPGKRWTRLEIYKKNKKGLKLLSSLRFTIKKIPDPVAQILPGKTRISKTILESQLLIMVILKRLI